MKIEDQLPAKKLKLSTNGESVIVEHESADGKTEENGTQVDEHDSQCHIQSKDATANLDKTGSIAVKDQTVCIVISTCIASCYLWEIIAVKSSI